MGVYVIRIFGSPVSPLLLPVPPPNARNVPPTPESPRLFSSREHPTCDTHNLETGRGFSREAAKLAKAFSYTSGYDLRWLTCGEQARRPLVCTALP